MAVAWCSVALPLLGGCVGRGGGSTGGGSATTTPVPRPKTDRVIALGIFNEQCAQCHTLQGAGKKGSIPIDHEGSFRTAAWLKVQIRHPEQHNPKTAMPLFPPDRITDKDLNALVKYLMTLK